MIGAWWRGAAIVGAWGLAVAWCARAYGAVVHFPKLPNLNSMRWNRAPVHMPSLTVVVPACNEAADIGATLESLAAQDYSWLQILAVNDRSTDSTGAIIDEIAERFPQRIRTLHVTELPDGWLGKTHAVHLAVQESDSQYLLFTDADVYFEPSILKRALAYAEQENVTHLVVGPTPVVRSLGEGMILGFLQVLGLWATRLWKVADPKAKRDVIGVGAFNLVRRDALEAIGGLAPQRLAVLEDVTLGMRMKAAGMSQHLVFAPGMVQVHWAPGISGIIGVTTKNFFATVNFRLVLMLAACLGIFVLFLAPLAGLVWWPTLLPSLIVLGCIVLAHRAMKTMTSIKTSYVALYPVGAVVVIWAMLRSMVIVLARGGVVWRGTHYPLRELRRHNSPLQWQRRS